ncbi:tRNA uracil 4-sulfurtransferase ThiI [Priestia endophytica]|uniref:tRNA uracil 4-sulfurtransferase ThiI n=1 Tax=Priestia endophytica TaxID=135735 RepID=UPI000DCA304D|nr:tRNA uracil 4-sulfurtransferase ThiI [Priestia endophytica]RAS89010.1 tRNA 4-thiouridine(8) synthase ThiI [Priestia endophytica]
MKYDHILIRYGEISTKGQNRKKFVSRLRKNIKSVLYDVPGIEIVQTRDRMYIQLHDEDEKIIIERLRKVFGIQSFSLAQKVDNDIEKMKEAALEALKEYDKEGVTFKVSSRRSFKDFPYDTNGLNQTIGAHLLRNTKNLTVDVRNPDVNVKVEVRNEATYIMSGDYEGLGGLPVGTSGIAALMLSGGLDSPVAGYLTMKRGVEIEAVHFFSPPFTSERAKEKVVDLTKELTKYGGSIKLHIVPFTELQQLVHKQVPENYTMTSTRRMMLKIADKIRERNGGLAIVTGESLGQVASQTLDSMVAINDVTSTPVLRPLIATDKTEIISVSKKINTYDISIRPYEDCCTIFTPVAPKTRPKLEKVQRYEEFVDFDELIEKAVNETETILIQPNDSSNSIEESLF